jgi:hypothetical protein
MYARGAVMAAAVVRVAGGPAGSGASLPLESLDHGMRTVRWFCWTLVLVAVLVTVVL